MALYINIIINAIVSIIATRIVLKQLGEDYFGLYNLIAGTILLLSFLNGSMMVSAQRFMSIAIGEKNQKKLNIIFNVSSYIHIIVSFAIGVILLIIQPFLFSNFLNIGNAPALSVHLVYDIMVISSVLTISTLPYSAAINAHEDMHFFAISEIIVIITRFIAAIAIIFITKHQLIIYTFLMMVSVLVGYITKKIWCKRKYEECTLNKTLMRNKVIMKEMLGFVGWNTLGSFAVVIRNQGVAFILNIFFGVVINAAYGIANQINSLVLTFASTLTTVFTPTIVQSKGAGDEKKMIFVALISSKLSFLISSIMSLPILLFLPDILELWLGDYPEYTIPFCYYIIIAFLILQLFPGINRLIYATGKIKEYQITISITIISVLPIGLILLFYGTSPVSILKLVAVLQFVTLIETLYYAKKQVALNIYDTIFKFLLPASTTFMATLFISKLFIVPVGDSNWLTVLSQMLIIVCIYFTIYTLIVFSKQERSIFANIIKTYKA